MAYDDDDLDTELDQEDAKGLRGRLERAERENRKLKEQITVQTAQRLLADKGFDLVKPEELKGIDLKDLESKAEALQNERLDNARSVVRSRFMRQGLEGEDLEAAVDDFFGAPAPVTQEDRDFEEASAVARARQLPAGTSAPRIPADVHGFDAITAALAENHRKASRNR